MASKLVLQINNLEALERLIGGDTEIEIAVRQSTADAYCKKFVKPIADEMVKNLIYNAIAPLQKAFQAELSKYFIGQPGSYGAMLKDSYKSVFAEMAKKMIEEQAQEGISEAILDLRAQLESHVQKRIAEVDRFMNQISSEERFNYMVQEVTRKRIADIVSKTV
jgi:hypothetical protein